MEFFNVDVKDTSVAWSCSGPFGGLICEDNQPGYCKAKKGPKAVKLQTTNKLNF